MKYSILTCTDGNNIIRAEGITDKENAFKQFHHWCELLFNDDSFTTAMIKVLDENLDCVENKREYIVRVPETQPDEITE